MNNWNATELRRKEEPVKIQEPGIYTRLLLSKVERDDTKFKYSFTTTIGEEKYTDIAVFYTPNEGYTKTVKEQQTAIAEKMISIADAVGSPTEVSKLPPQASFMAFMETLNRYIESKANKAFVNIKIVMDSKGQYCKVADFGFIEKFTEGKESQLYFSTW